MTLENLELEIKKLYPRLLALAKQRLFSESEAEDAVQETIIKAIKGIESFRAESQMYTWLVRILFNVCTDFQRKSKRIIDMPDDGRVFLDLEANKFDQPEENYEQKWLFSRLNNAIMELKAEHKEVIILKYFENFSYDQIAEALGISDSLVKSRLYMARQALRKTVQLEI
jgi:RNA polymerase sigma-70 factor, ECF subfamily